MSTLPNVSLLSPSQRKSLSQMERHIEAQIPAAQFFKEFLALLRTATGATTAVFWRFNEHGNLQIGFEDSWEALKPLLTPEFGQHHRDSMKAALQQEMVTTREVVLNEQTGLRLTTCLKPIREGTEVRGVIELVFTSSLTREASDAVREFLDYASQLLAVYLGSLQTQHLKIDQSAFWSRFEPLLLELSRQKDSTALGFFLANELPTLLGVDRAYFAIQRGRQIELVAASNSSKLQKRSTMMLKLKKLLRSMRTRDRQFVYPDRQIEGNDSTSVPLSDYLQVSSTRMIAIQPIRLGKVTDQQALPNRKVENPAKTLGYLVVENLHDDRFEKSRREVLELTSLHTAGVLEQLRRVEDLPMYSVWRSIGRTISWCYRKQFGKSLAAILAVVAISLILTYVPWAYRVTATGKLMPVEQREVFAPWDAEVESVLVGDGDTVKVGQALVKLRNKELESEELRVRNMLQEKLTLVRTLRATRESNMRQGSEQDILELEGQLAEALVEIEHLQRQQEILSSRLDDLVVKSTIDGVVATFQLEQILRHRPVTRGEVLLEVMDPDGPWHLELQLDDYRMGHLMAEQARLKQPLHTSFILATEPTIAYDGMLKTIGTRAYADQEAQKNVVDMQVDFDKETVPARRIGAEVKAKINCGEKSLGYVLFGDMIDYVRSTLWL
ncbi:efflux RND transporter periplasmic adaptor subunit [Lacunimicrobium album]